MSAALKPGPARDILYIASDIPALERARAVRDQAAARHGITPAELAGQERAFVHVRRQAIREVRAAVPALSLRAIGDLFGDRDHTTIGTALGFYSSGRRRTNP